MSGITQADIQELGNKFNTFTQHFEKQVKDNVSAVEATFRDEQKKITDAVLTKYDELAEQSKKLQTNVDDLATKMNRTGNAYTDFTPEAKEAKKNLDYFNNARRVAWAGKAMSADKANPITQDQSREYTKAHEAWVRYGDNRIQSDPELTKAMAVGSDPDGGYWISPPEKATQIVTRIRETSPMRTIANTVTISAHSYQYMVDPNRMSIGGWVAELQTRPETSTPTLGMQEIVPQEVYAQPGVSQVMLEDAGFDVESYIDNKSAETFALETNATFVVGNGVAKPRGFLNYNVSANTDGSNKWGEIGYVGSGVSGQFTYATLVKLLTSLKGDKYYSNARLLMKRETVQSLLTIQNGSNQFIFQPINSGQFNDTPILGYPITYMADMPAVAAGAYAVAYGDFRQAYTIVDRVGISTLRDPYSRKGVVLFYKRMRVGAGLVDFDALKLYRLS